jgi:hypothetical protein
MMSQTIHTTINPDRLCDCDRGIAWTDGEWYFCPCPRGQAAKEQAEDNVTEARIAREENEREYYR